MVVGGYVNAEGSRGCIARLMEASSAKISNFLRRIGGFVVGLEYIRFHFLD